jgi:3-oxoacyl-ACP reductase-like protein
MSIFGNIMSAIFGSSASAAPAAPASAPGAAQAAPGAPATPAARAAPAAAPMSAVDVAAVMDGLAKQSKQKLDWRKSIVDLMKLLDMDSSLAARKQLAQELRYTGDMGDSAKMNIWLHKQVMIKLAENGGKVPEDLKS